MGQYEVTFAGFGGQGIMTAGQLFAYSGINEGKQVVWIPSYGPEMRGGTAFCTVVVSEERIGSPIINKPRGLVVFNRPSFDKFEPRIKPDGLLVVNSSLINVKSERTDIQSIYIPANEIAHKAGSPKSTNIVMLGAFIGASEAVKYESFIEAIESKLGKKKDLLETNLKVALEGYRFARKELGMSVTV